MGYSLKIISSTVRQGRKGPLIARWITEIADKNTHFDVELVDLGELNLPMMDEPKHPRFREYEHKHTKAWSGMIEPADAFIFVTAEYDHSYPAPLKNALQYLVHEWAYKPAGIVSYGGVSAGTRAMTQLKSDLVALKVVPLFEAVNLPFFTQFIDDEDNFKPNDVAHKAADTMLKELVRWTKGLKSIREDAS